jgi:hypothetical protein
VIANRQHRTIITEAEDAFESYVEKGVESDEFNFNWTAKLIVTRNGKVIVERNWELRFIREMM